MDSLPFGAELPKTRSLEHIYKPISAPIQSTGCNNRGIVVVKSVLNGLKCVEKRFRRTDINNGNAKFEMLMLRACNHRNIVGYVDSFVDRYESSPRASIFMEYADLGNLEDFYKSRRAAQKPPFTEVAMWNLFAQLVDAVGYLQHGIKKATSADSLERRKSPGWIGIVHRDIKPANIFLRSNPGSPFPTALLGDFGQAIRDDNQNWVREIMFGDPAWSPPEYPDYTWESDIWSIGVTMQATCSMRGFTSLRTGTQDARGTCEHFSGNMNRVMLSTLRVRRPDRPNIMELARTVGDEARRD